MPALELISHHKHTTTLLSLSQLLEMNKRSHGTTCLVATVPASDACAAGMPPPEAPGASNVREMLALGWMTQEVIFVISQYCERGRHYCRHDRCTDYVNKRYLHFAGLARTTTAHRPHHSSLLFSLLTISRPLSIPQPHAHTYRPPTSAQRN